MIKRGVVFCLALSLAACAGREPIPVSTSNALDQQMSCLELDREVGRNNASMRVLVGEDNDRTGRNIMVGAVGLLLFWPALAALDFKDAAGKEMAALDSRNDMLGELARQKNCTIQVALSSEAAKEAYEANFDEDGNPVETPETAWEEPSPDRAARFHASSGKARCHRSRDRRPEISDGCISAWRDRPGRI